MAARSSHPHFPFLPVIDTDRMDVQRLDKVVEISALIAGFAFTALAQISVDPRTPSWLVVLFALSTTCLICIYLFALLISINIVPNLDAYEQLRGMVGTTGPLPYREFKVYISIAWFFATGMGVLMFLAAFVIATWTQFYFASKEAGISTALYTVPIMILLAVYLVKFHRRLVALHVQLAKASLEHSSPVHMV